MKNDSMCVVIPSIVWTNNVKKCGQVSIFKAEAEHTKRAELKEELDARRGCFYVQPRRLLLNIHVKPKALFLLKGTVTKTNRRPNKTDQTL